MDTALEKRTMSKVSWRIIPFIMILYFVAFLDRVNIGFAAIHMNEDIGLDPAIFGLGAGLFFIGYFLFEVPSNLALEKFGARLWIARVMVTWGLISGAMAFVQGPHSFYILRFLLGVAEAGFFPGIILYLSYWFPAKNRAVVTAFFMAAAPISVALGSPVSGALLEMDGLFGMHGWQWMFLIEAVPAVVLGLVLLAYLDNGVKSAKWLAQDEKDILARNIAADSSGKDEHQSVFVVLRDPRVWVMCLIYFSFVMGQYGLTFWMPTLVKASGVSGDFNIGLLSAIPFICAIVAMVFFSRSADARRERRWHLVIPALLGAVGFVVAATASSTAIAIVFLSMAAAGVLACAPLFWSLPTAFLSGAAAASGIAFINSVANLAGFASPYLIGTLRDMTQSSAMGMYVLAGFLVLGAAIVLMVPAKLVNR